MKLLKTEIEAKLKSGEITPEQAVDEFAQAMGVAGKRKYAPPSINDIKGRYASNIQLRERARSGAIPFITPDVEFKLTQGLILIGGVSGQGKSTTFANLLAGFMMAKPSGRALAITNEETNAVVYDRTSCALLGLNFKKYYEGNYSAQEEAKIQETSLSLTENIVVEEGQGKYDMTVLEHVEAALIHAAEGGYDLALVDYLQTVNQSELDPTMDPVTVSKKLGFFLKDYSRKVRIPIVIFAQLKPRSEAPDFQSRIQNDRTIFNHAFAAIEVVPDFETRTTKFVIAKDRFSGHQGEEIEMTFQNGKFLYTGGL